jgi:hypothetical protein
MLLHMYVHMHSLYIILLAKAVNKRLLQQASYRVYLPTCILSVHALMRVIIPSCEHRIHPDCQHVIIYAGWGHGWRDSRFRSFVPSSGTMKKECTIFD